MEVSKHRLTFSVVAVPIVGVAIQDRPLNLKQSIAEACSQFYRVGIVLVELANHLRFELVEVLALRAED